LKIFRRRKNRIKRDAAGSSARQRAFGLFGEGRRPAEVSRTIGIPTRTAYRYFEDYKKLHNRLPYSQIKKWMRKNPQFNEKVIDLLVSRLDISREETIALLEKPWGLAQGMAGKWPNYRLNKQQTDIEARLLAALEIVNFADKFGQKDPQKVREVLQQLMMGDSEEERGETQ